MRPKVLLDTNNCNPRLSENNRRRTSHNATHNTNSTTKSKAFVRQSVSLSSNLNQKETKTRMPPRNGTEPINTSTRSCVADGGR